MLSNPISQRLAFLFRLRLRADRITVTCIMNSFEGVPLRRHVSNQKSNKTNIVRMCVRRFRLEEGEHKKGTGRTEPNKKTMAFHVIFTNVSELGSLRCLQSWMATVADEDRCS